MSFNISAHRHWKELMERTGTSFEMNPDTFTLENMFAMELHKYANVIGDIVTAAVKELSIEKVSFPLNIQYYLEFSCNSLLVKLERYYVERKHIIYIKYVYVFVCVFPGSEGGGGDLGKHEVYCAALF